jgi:hypothetical protein
VVQDFLGPDSKYYNKRKAIKEWMINEFEIGSGNKYFHHCKK